MKDEEYVFRQDAAEKSKTARSARNRRSNCGKGGRVKLPSDYMTKKEIKAMSGEVKSYRLNEPMGWKEFKKMPDDIKVTYIKLLREKFDCFDSAIAEMMGVNKCTFSQEVKRLGLGHGTKHGGYRKWDKEAFLAWANGVPLTEETTEEVLEEQVPETEVVEENACEDSKEVNCCLPLNGQLTFDGDIDDICNTLRMVMNGSKVKMYVKWSLVGGNYGQ